MPDTEKDNPPQANGLNRRQFLRGVGLVGAGSALVPELIAPETADAAPLAPEPAVLETAPLGKTLQKGFQSIALKVNGQNMTMEVEPRTTLLNALRNHADPPVTGPKLVCDQGACGGCTVMVNGKNVYGCMQLAMDCVGKEIVTVEGLAKDGKLTPVQEAFIEHDALMCGFCTPGFIMAVTALLQKNNNPTLGDVKAACEGNVCRCGTYPKVFDAALAAAKKMRGGA